MDIKEIIAGIPWIMRYFVPGYIGLFAYQFLRGKSSKQSSNIIPSFIISYVVCLITDFIFQNNIDSIILCSIAEIILAVIIMCTAAWLMTTSVFQNFLLKFHITSNDEIWFDILDEDKEQLIKLIPQNENSYVLGYFAFCEYKNNDPWLALYGFSVYDSDGNEQTDYTEIKNTYYMIKKSDIKHIEVIDADEVAVYQRNAMA